MRIFPLLLLALTITAVSSAEEVLPELPSDPGLRMLRANRSLLAQFEAEYAKLKQKESEVPTDTVRRQLMGAKYKIAALKDDNQRLEATTAVAQQAEDFLKDVLKREPLPSHAVPVAPVSALPELPPLTNLTSAERHEKALELVAAKRMEEATRLYQEIVLEDPDDDQAYLIMGHTYLLRHQYENAERAFQNAVSINRGNLNEIAPFYENLTIQTPDDDDAWANLGYAYAIIGRPESAADAFKDALDINPENEEAARGLWMLSKGPEKTQ